MEINRQYISKVNTYAGKNNSNYIVIHESDNYNTGSGAKRHAEAQSKGHLNSMSAHYYCGSDGIYQAAEHQDGTWSIGKEYGGNHSVKDASNLNSINIEICVNPDGDYNVARANAIELVKHLIKTTGIPADRVIRHFDAKGKYCPRKMMDNPALWEDFKAQISAKEGSYIHEGVDYALVFNPAYYSARYSDLKKAFGCDAVKLFNHFIQYGMKEGRRACETFDVKCYKNTYLDLRNAYADNLPAYYKHYAQCGKREGRKAVPVYEIRTGEFSEKEIAETIAKQLIPLGFSEAKVYKI